MKFVTVLFLLLGSVFADLCYDPATPRSNFIEAQCCSIACPPINPFTRTEITRELNLIIPAYVYPTNNGVLNNEWNILKNSVQTHRDVRHVIILNPANGANAVNPPNIDWVQVVDLFKDEPNAVLIGYVSTKYGVLTTAEEDTVKAQIDGYFSDWSCQGIFFDEVTGDRQLYVRFIGHTRPKMADQTNVFNFGSKADANGVEYDENWLKLAELNIMLENKFSEVASFTPSSAQLALDRDRSGIILLDTDVSDIDLRDMYSKHFGYVYFVDREFDYNGIYSQANWDTFMTALTSFSSGPAAAGQSCASGPDCLSGVCNGGKCCSSAVANCAACSSTGSCESCAVGFSLVNGACVENTNVAAGGACSADGQCADNKCLGGVCCNQWMNDANCAVCDSGGWCATCKEGTSYVAGQGCV